MKILRELCNLIVILANIYTPIHTRPLRHPNVVKHVYKDVGRAFLEKGSTAIAPEENCLPIPKLTLSQTLTLTVGKNFSDAIVCSPPTLKLTLTLTQMPTLTREQFSLWDNCLNTLEKQSHNIQENFVNVTCIVFVFLKFLKAIAMVYLH